MDILGSLFKLNAIVKLLKSLFNPVYAFKRIWNKLAHKVFRWLKISY